jgi:hypothetical protein
LGETLLPLETKMVNVILTGFVLNIPIVNKYSLICCAIPFCGWRKLPEISVSAASPPKKIELKNLQEPSTWQYIL